MALKDEDANKKVYEGTKGEEVANGDRSRSSYSQDRPARKSVSEHGYKSDRSRRSRSKRSRSSERAADSEEFN